MKSSTTVSRVIYPNERCHPGHSKEVLARVDELARYLNRNKYDPTGEGKRAKKCWAKAYDRFRRMQAHPCWWQDATPRQFAIANPTGEVISNYKVPEPSGSPLPKHDVDVARVRAELRSQIGGASLSEEDIAYIKTVLERSRNDFTYHNKLVCLWARLYEDYRALKRISSGNLKDHGWEFSGADEFNRPDGELSQGYKVDERHVAALRKGLYVMLRKRKGAPSALDLHKSFRAIGIELDLTALSGNAA